MGSYNFNFWIDQGNSGDCTGGSPECTIVTINQSGDPFTLLMGGTYPGTVSDATYTGERSYPMGGGTTTEIVIVTLTSASSGSGTGGWYWTDGFYWCQGGYTVSMTKDGSCGGGGGGGGGCFIEQLFVHP